MGCCTLQAQLDAQAEALAALRQEVTELRARLDRDSSNSSKPPASGHPHACPQPPARPNQATRSQRGAQPGHPGTTQALLPVAKVSQVILCQPTVCGQCTAPFSPEAPSPAPAAIREQVWELPPLTWENTEYQRRSRTCAASGARIWGRRPPEAPEGCLAFRAQAALGLFKGGVQLSRRSALTLAQELLGLPLSLGTLSRVVATLTAALAAPYAEVAAAVAAAPVVYCDESPWREPGGSNGYGRPPRRP